MDDSMGLIGQLALTGAVFVLGAVFLLASASPALYYVSLGTSRRTRLAIHPL